MVLQVSLQLVQLHNYIKNVVRKACEEALVGEGFVPDPMEEEEEQGGECTAPVSLKWRPR